MMACSGIVYYGHQVARALVDAVETSARADGRATAHEIVGFIDREHERLHAFTLEKADEIRSILSFPDDWPAIEALQTSIKRMFRGAIAFSVTGADGRPLFEDFDGLVGPVCEASMRDYLDARQRGDGEYTLPPIHPVPDAYHFDLITEWQLEDGATGLFFISMSPDRIAELIAAAEQASGARILLVNRDDPSLIEVTSGGARDTLSGDFRVEPEELAAGHYAVDLPGTEWRLLVLPDAAALAASVRQVYFKVAGLVLALLAISAALLFAIRRFEQRNSGLFMRSLQSSLSRQRAILQSMVDGMVTTDATGKIRHVNHAVTKLFGYQTSELIGANVRMLMPEPHRSAHDGYMRHYLDTGERKIIGKGREVMGRRKDGSLFPVLLTLGESIEGDEHIFVGILHDMSAYNAAQRKIVEQASMIERSRQELDEISQIASKDLQLPLQRIAVLGARLGSEPSDAMDGNRRAQLKTLADEVRDMSELAKGLADYAHVERAPVDQVVDLDEVLREVQRDLAGQIAQTGAEVSVGPLGSVLGNADQLRQVFWNLLDNALKFRDPGRPPQIRVSLGSAADRPDETAPARLVVRVDDNGIGIPADKHDAVFEAFGRLHPREAYPGIGLGLSFCRKIVEGLDGTIDVEGRPDEGSRFRVTLRRAG
jgi:PAS domain S-box-containing protein